METGADCSLYLFAALGTRVIDLLLDLQYSCVALSLLPPNCLGQGRFVTRTMRRPNRFFGASLVTDFLNEKDFTTFLFAANIFNFF
jgi:hypothetical protein